MSFYTDVLQKLNHSGIPFLIGGGYAFRAHSGLIRDTSDVDIFCKPSDYPNFLKLLKEDGFDTEIRDARWIAKASKDEDHIDFIFNSVNGICTVDDFWFERSVEGSLFDVPIRYVGPVETIWCKAYMCDRYRYDGADINHIILNIGDELDWKWLMHRMDNHWQLLFAHILMFRFVYPSRQKNIPKWVWNELISRLNTLMDLSSPKDKVCNGPLISQSQYAPDITEWGYKVLTYDTI